MRGQSFRNHRPGTLEEEVAGPLLLKARKEQEDQKRAETPSGPNT